MKILTWGTMMVDVIAANLPKIADPGIIFYTENGIGARTGGHPIDVSIDLVQMNVSPKDVGIVSAIGNDMFGKFLEDKLKKHRIKDFVQRVKVGNGKTLILSVKGEDRRCHLDPGASLHMSIEHLERVVKKIKPHYFTFRPGYTNIDLKFGNMLRRLRKNVLSKSFLLLDVCAPYKKSWSYFLKIIPYVDAIHGNRHEIIRIANERNFNKATKKLISKGIKAIFLTKDKDGAEIIMKDKKIAQPGIRVKAVEPSGAGDAFCAGIIYSLYNWKKHDLNNLTTDKLSRMLLFAQSCGAACVEKVGCTEGVTRNRVYSILKKNEKKVLKNTNVKEF